MSEQRTFNILAVEDDAANLHLIIASLQDAYQISVAKTLAKARELIQKKSFDIILLDVQLPDGSGMDFCKELLSQSEHHGDLRVIFITGLTSAEDEVRGLNLGAADYIHKPIVKSVLMARVRLQAQLIRRNELLGKLARVDGLTEIANRRAFDQKLLDEWQRAKREHKSLTLAMIDIDYFKRYNDHYGHPAGDKCLHDVAQFLNRFFRRSADFVARYGGEEFTVLLPDTPLEEAEKLFRQAQLELETLGLVHAHSEVRKTVTFSVGLCCANPELDNVEDFVQAADAQLYAAKEAGRAQAKGCRL